MRLQKRRRRAWLAAAGAIAGAVLAWPAMAQQSMGPGPLSPERIAFDAADTNGDGIVSGAELARDAAHGFATLDKNGDGKLPSAELAPHDPALFRRVDANGDGVLTFQEVMANKMRALKAGDKNQDSGLSFDEMTAIVQSELGGAS